MTTMNKRTEGFEEPSACRAKSVESKDMNSNKTQTIQQIKADVLLLNEWLCQTPHLPNIKDKVWLETVLRNCKFDLEKTKTKLNSYFTLKNKYPGILKNRNPRAPELLKSRRAITLAISDRITSEGYLLVYHKYEEDPNIFHAYDYFKRISMVHDVILLERLAPNGISFVADVGNFRYQHFLKMIRHVSTFIEILSCFADKLKAAYVISSSKLVQQMFPLLKRLSPEKLVNRVRIHGVTSSSMRNQVDPNILCSDFGGEGSSLALLEEKTQKLLEKNYGWFQEQDELCSNI